MINIVNVVMVKLFKMKYEKYILLKKDNESVNVKIKEALDKQNLYLNNKKYLKCYISIK